MSVEHNVAGDGVVDDAGDPGSVLPVGGVRHVDDVVGVDDDDDAGDGNAGDVR